MENLTELEKKLIVYALKAYRGDFYTKEYPNSQCPFCGHVSSIWKNEVTALLAKVENSELFRR